MALLVLAGLLLILGNVAYWVNHSILDSNNFSDDVDGVLRRPETAQRVGDAVALRVASSGELQARLSAELPERLSFLPVLLEGQIQDLISTAVSRVVMLDVTQAAIDAAVRNLHQIVVETLENRRRLTSLQGNSIVLNLDMAVDDTLSRLGVSAERLQSRDLGTVVLVENAKPLRQASILVRSIETAVPVLFAGALLAIGASFVLSPNKIKCLSATGYCLVFAGLVSLALWGLAILAASDFLSGHPVAFELVKSLANALKWQSIFFVIIGGLAVLGADHRVRDQIAQLRFTATRAVETAGPGRTVLLCATAVVVLALIF
jgi:hypothetical protein